MGQYFATVAPGLEAIAAQELSQLGAEAVEPGSRGVAFRGSLELLYRVNLWARVPFRVLLQIAAFPCQDAEALYAGVAAIDWQVYLTPEQTLMVTATGQTPALNHTHFTALQVKNAIVDQQRDRTGRRSTVDKQHPDVRIVVHLNHKGAVVSLDSSGHSLHRRGYRAAVGHAPLKESLAAALIYWSHWHPSQAFCDPLCGSGTLPIEAAQIGLHRAPGLSQPRFGFERWLEFDAGLWQQLRQQAQAAAASHLAAPIVGSDRDPQVMRLAHHNARQAGVSDCIELLQRDLTQVEAPASEGIVMCNPPYGARLGHPEALGAFYRQLGDVLKQRFKGWTAYVLSGNKQLASHIRLRSAQRLPVYNGTLPCQLMKYELY